jgi:hypothetical protein
MKTKTIAILAIAIATFTLAAAPAASAADCGYRYGVVTVGYCAPRYVCTKEICRRTECRWATDHCGRRYSYMVTVITFADHYSDGSRRTYTRTYRA